MCMLTCVVYMKWPWSKHSTYVQLSIQTSNGHAEENITVTAVLPTQYCPHQDIPRRCESPHPIYEALKDHIKCMQRAACDVPLEMK